MKRRGRSGITSSAMIMVFSCLYLPLLLLPFIFLHFVASHLRRRPKLYNLPPGPPSLPIIGNLHNLRDLPHLSLHALAQRYGPLMHLKLGQVPAIVISGADEAFEILKAQDHIFCSRARLAAGQRFSYGGIDVAFSPYNDHWKHLRRLCNAELFGPARVLSFAGIRREEVGALVRTISRASSRAEAVNLSDILLCFFNNMIYRVVFGKPTSGDCGKMKHQDLLREVVTLMAELSAGDLFPSFRWLDAVTGWQAKLDSCFRRMDRLFGEEIEERLKSAADGRNDVGDAAAHEDLLYVVLRLQAKEGDTSPSLEEIKALLMDMFTAGTDTSAAAIEWTMVQLMRNPKAMKKAVEEVRRVASDKGMVEETDLQHLHYLKMVIKETLRLNPPGPMLPPRECIKDTMVCGYDIPANTSVYVNLWAIGRDRRRWPDDPEDFRPDRFEGSPINYKGTHFELIPFGAGRRMCPGMALAMASVELVLANILCCFNWELPLEMTKEDIDMKASFGLVTPKKLPLLLLPIHYHPNPSSGQI